MIYWSIVLVLIGELSCGKTVDKKLSDAAIYTPPIWSCYSDKSSLSKTYEFMVYRRIGDKRFQFVLTQMKPANKILFDFAENMDSYKDGLPTKTLPSKALFSFSIDTTRKLSDGGYAARLMLDQSWDKKNRFVFSENDPLILTCNK